MGRRKGPALTRAEVVAAALTIVRDEGADALGVTRVARALGIQPPSVYSHVGKGDALARAVVLEANRQLVQVFKDAVRGVIAPRDQLWALASTTRQWAHDNGGLYTLMARIQPQNDDPSAMPIYQDLIDLFARPFGQLGVGEADQVHAIRALRSAVHGFVLLETAGQFQLDVDRERSFRWMVESLVAHLGPEHRA